MKKSEKHYRLVWYLKNGEEVVGATMHPTKESAEEEAHRAVARRENWSRDWEVREYE